MVERASKKRSAGHLAPVVRQLGPVRRLSKSMKTNSYAAQSATTPLAPFTIQRRDPGEHDVQIQILYCGVCHSDVHTVRNEWQGTT